MKIKTINLYEFKELSEDAKREALDNLRYINVDFDDWSTPTLEDWKERLSRQGFEDAEINFSGFYSQGDGACFTSSVNLKKFIKGHRLDTKFAKVIKDYGDGCASADIVRISNQYDHEFCVSTDCENIPSDLEDIILDSARDQMRKIYKELRGEYFSLTSDEEVLDTIEANEYLFTSEGKLESL